MKVVAITGASSGLGKELAKLYLQKDYILILNGINEKGFEEFSHENNVHIVLGDITNADTRTKIFDKIKKQGKIDILINNAGITYIQPFEKNTEEQLDKLFSVDLKAPILLTQKIYPLMVDQKSGTIINVNSSAGKEAKVNHTIYNAAKFGLTGFTKSLRLEAKQHGIRVLSIHPGGMNTPFYDSLETPPDISSFMEPSKVANVIFYLSELEGMSPDEIDLNRLSK